MSKKNKNMPSSPEENVKVVTKRKGGCGFFAGFFSCILMIVLVIGGFGLYVYNAVTISQIESLLGVKIPVEGDIRDKPVKDLITLALDTKDSYVHMTINDLPEKVGVDLPTTIPGTDISITFVYDADIQFMDQNIKVRDAEIMDVANNIDAFVDAVLPVVYDNILIGEILSSFDLADTLNEMGYPAFTDPLYNVGTDAQPSFKALNDLTITQAKNVLVDYYGEDNLTIQTIVNAVGLQDIIPDAVAGETDIYAGLRNLLVASCTTDDILSNITGAILADHIDLSDYRFASRDTFLVTSILDMPDYIQTIPLSDLMNVPESMEDADSPSLKLLYALRNATLDTFMADEPMDAIIDLIDSEQGWQNLNLGTLLSRDTLGDIHALCNVKLTDLLRDSENTIENLLKTITLGDMITINTVTADDFFETNPEFTALDGIRYSRIQSEVRELQLNQILTPAQITDIANNGTALDTVQLNCTLYELMGYDFTNTNDNTRTLQDIIPVATLNEIGGFMYELCNSTILTINSDYDALTVQQILGTGNELSTIVQIADITLYTLLNDKDALSTIMDEFGTIGELCGSTTGIFSIIGNITISDMLNNPNSIMDTIKASDKTLADLLEITAPTGIMKEIAGIEVGDLFTDANDAINTALESSTTKLSELLGLTNPTGIMSIVADIEIGDLLTDPDAISNTLKASDKTLADLLNITDNTGIMSIIKDVEVGDLFTNASSAITTKLQSSSMTLAELIGLDSPTGMVGTITTTITVADLFGNDASTALTNAINGVKLNELFTNVTSSDTILYALLNKNPNTTIQNINTAIGGLRLADVLGCYTYKADGTDDVFTAPTTGVFALFTQDQLNTSVNNISDIDLDLAETTISRLIEVELLTGTVWEISPFNQAEDNTFRDVRLASVTVEQILIYAIAYDCYDEANSKLKDGYTGNLLTDFINSITSV